MDKLLLPEVVTVGARRGDDATTHALRALLSDAYDNRGEAWSFTDTRANRTICGNQATGRVSKASGRGVALTCQRCESGITRWVAGLGGMEIPPWEFYTRPEHGEKFGSVAAERLHDLSMESFHDQEIGETETFGWFGLFDSECAILEATSQGFVTAVRFADTATLHAEWTALELKYDEWEEVNA